MLAAADGRHIHIPVEKGSPEATKTVGKVVAGAADISAQSRWKLLRRCQTATLVAAAAKKSWSLVLLLVAAHHCCYYSLTCY